MGWRDYSSHTTFEPLLCSAKTYKFPALTVVRFCRQFGINICFSVYVLLLLFFYFIFWKYTTFLFSFLFFALWFSLPHHIEFSTNWNMHHFPWEQFTEKSFDVIAKHIWDFLVEGLIMQLLESFSRKRIALSNAFSFIRLFNFSFQNFSIHSNYNMHHKILFCILFCYCCLVLFSIFSS